MNTRFSDWREVFAGNDDFQRFPLWTEVAPGCWVGEEGGVVADGPRVAVVVTGGTDQPTVILATMRAGLPDPRPMEWLRLHDRLADMLRDSGHRVGCAGPECAYAERWPCPVREAWAHPDMIDKSIAGDLHVPTVLLDPPGLDKQ